jgi:Mce-associated membrane protein
MNRGVSVAVATAALVVTLAAGALAAVTASRLSHANATTESRQQALAAARQIAVDFAAYDYRQIDKDFARVAAQSTGSFRQQYVQQSAGVRDLIVQVKAVSTAQAVAAAVVNSSARAATVVVALNRTVANTKVPKGTTDAFGVQIGLVRRGDRWLASAVKPL